MTIVMGRVWRPGPSVTGVDEALHGQPLDDDDHKYLVFRAETFTLKASHDIDPASVLELAIAFSVRLG